MLKFFFGALAVIVTATPAWAWSEHVIITRAALRNLWDWTGHEVQVTPLESLLADLGYADPVALNEGIEIRKDYRFGFKADEKVGSSLPALDVVSIYSDEPDWGMDENLFEEDQYPQLWRDEYTMMGGRVGVGSRAFRHLFWRAFTPLHPLKTFKMPFREILSAMGTAPARAATFLDLSRRARAKGHEYWSLRFLGNALHYLEDVASPYHSTQSPTKKFALMPFTDWKYGRRTRNYVTQVTNVVTYYHFGFEDYVGKVMRKYANGEEAEDMAVGLDRTLADTSKTFTKLRYQNGDVTTVVKALADASIKVSSKAARASIKFFPRIRVAFDQLKVEEYQNEAWWAEVFASGNRSSRAKTAFVSVCQDMFAPVGFAVRQVVQAELSR